MSNSNLRHRWFPSVITLAGLALLATITRAPTDQAVIEQSWIALLLWGVMLSMATLSPLPLPRGTRVVALTPGLDLAALLAFGPTVAAWLVVGSRVVSSSVDRWQPFSSSVLRVGSGLLSVIAAGVVFKAWGGDWGQGLLVNPGQLSPVLAAGVAYLLVDKLIRLADRAVSGCPGVEGHLAALGRGLGFGLMALAFGVFVALTQVRIGVLGATLFLFPLLLARYTLNLWLESRRTHIVTVRTFMMALDASDPFTRGHAYRISKMAVQVARRLGVSDKEIEEIEYAALLHDIGRTAIHRDIRTKPGRLTQEEQHELRTHPSVGYEVLKDLKFFPAAAEIVYAHHEQPDGNGYPRGIKADEIPLGSRVIMAVAAFDAMTSDRPYRRGLAPEAAFDELLEHAGTQFFPEIVETLLDLYSEGTLFDDFEEDELWGYVDGQGNSRALEDYLEKRRGGTAVPKKLDSLEIEAETEPDDGVPVLELLDYMEKKSVTTKEFQLSGENGGKLIAAGLSDVGCVRSNNEDSYGMFTSKVSTRGCLLVLADGMGGAAAGEVASELAVDTLQAAYFGDEVLGGASEALRRVMTLANEIIYAKASADSRLGGMGTTCTAAAVVGRELSIGHVGDSRAYLVRDGSISALTTDHTLAAELEQMAGANEVSPTEARNVLTRCLGTQPSVQVEMSESVHLKTGDTVVLCSDGLSNMAEPDEVLDAVNRHDPTDACRRLVDLARDRGGPDNITVVVARVED